MSKPIAQTTATLTTKQELDLYKALYAAIANLTLAKFFDIWPRC